MSARYSCNRDVLFTQLDDGTAVLLNLGSGLYYTLNRPGVVVWKSLGQGASDLPSLVERLCSTFDVDRVEAEREVIRLLGELKTDGLIRAS